MNNLPHAIPSSSSPAETQSSGARVIYIVGGQRSGKSAFAERMALQLSPNPVYVATARPSSDAEMQLRIRRHQERRGSAWTTMEEPLHLCGLPLAGRVALVDCVTLWAANALFEHADCAADALAFMRAEVDALARLADATIIFVSNEVGLGGISANALQRQFADLQGDINQWIAARANEAYLIVSGLPLKLK